MQSVLPRFTPRVKALLIANVSIWLLVQLIFEKFIFNQHIITSFFSMTPSMVVDRYFMWQPLTYMFFHAPNNLTHILFNMLMLWFFGSELEQKWGSRYFLKYYLLCGVGAAFLYLGAAGLLTLFQSRFDAGFDVPVLGASGALFGLMVAYGIEFKDRLVYFYGVFPLKAQVLVMIMGGIEILSLLVSGANSGVAHFAHLGGIAVGFFLLKFKNRKNRPKSPRSPRGPTLRLVINNEDQKDPNGPKYWN